MHFFHILFISSFCYAVLGDNSCLFEHSTYGVIDLRSLGFQTGRARFQDVSMPSSAMYNYSFNPCYSFTESACDNVAVCQTAVNGLYSFSLAIQNQSRWTIDSDRTPALIYTYNEKTVAISMVCTYNAIDEFEILGENPMNYYSMRLRSRCACWNGCKTPEPTTTTARPPPPTSRVIYSSACMYHDSKYGTIDLSSIGSMSGTPAFKDVSSIYPNNFLWSYNPCYKFSEASCQNVSGCQIDMNRGVSYTIGLQDHAYWINMDSTNNSSIQSIVYPSSSMNRRLTVQLICDQTLSTHYLQVFGETASNEYTMKLRSPCACWNGCTQSPSQPFDWTFGIVTAGICLVIFLVFSMIIACLFCGKRKRHQSYPVIVVNEKTPFFTTAINNHK